MSILWIVVCAWSKCSRRSTEKFNTQVWKNNFIKCNTVTVYYCTLIGRMLPKVEYYFVAHFFVYHGSIFACIFWFLILRVAYTILSVLIIQPTWGWCVWVFSWKLTAWSNEEACTSKPQCWKSVWKTSRRQYPLILTTLIFITTEDRYFSKGFFFSLKFVNAISKVLL